MPPSPRTSPSPPAEIVSVLVPVLNEADLIEETLDAMLEQRFEGEVELVFLDGGSTDDTREILARRSAEEPSVLLLDNPSRRVPNALNIGLRKARGQFIARMDAHTFYPDDYLARGVERLRAGDVDWVSGPQIAEGADPWSRAIALALSVPLGVGGARFRSALDREVDVDTGFTGVWHRATLEALGGWDERWPVNQDSELAARVRERGGRIVCVPEMAARYVPRASLGALARQYWAYGQFRAKTSLRHPQSMRRSHLLPPALLGLTAVAALGGSRAGRIARLGLLGYVGLLVGEALRQARAGHGAAAVRLPLVLATMHLVWGAGLIVGGVKFAPGRGSDPPS